MTQLNVQICTRILFPTRHRLSGRQSSASDLSLTVCLANKMRGKSKLSHVRQQQQKTVAATAAAAWSHLSPRQTPTPPTPPSWMLQLQLVTDCLLCGHSWPTRRTWINGHTLSESIRQLTHMHTQFGEAGLHTQANQPDPQADAQFPSNNWAYQSSGRDNWGHWGCWGATRPVAGRPKGWHFWPFDMWYKLRAAFNKNKKKFN